MTEARTTRETRNCEEPAPVPALREPCHRNPCALSITAQQVIEPSGSQPAAATGQPLLQRERHPYCAVQLPAATMRHQDRHSASCKMMDSTLVLTRAPPLAGIQWGALRSFWSYASRVVLLGPYVSISVESQVDAVHILSPDRCGNRGREWMDGPRPQPKREAGCASSLLPESESR